MSTSEPRFTTLQQPLTRTDIVTEALPGALDDGAFTPRHLALLSNALVWAQSQAFRQEFALATNEWRVLSALASRPGQSATEISESLSANKAVISASVNTLAARGLLVLVDGARRSRALYLTGDGAEMHDRMAPIAMRGQRLIEEELGPAELSELNALLQRLTERARRLNDRAR
ncbi:MarR family winged helix-turn-helix transcriptional regulator [Luethyella okanaganae]|uniref:MarR family winged helix-turn-helix transcriptional regulator n=1 Tax=Luethyella okanaganae TaxID=69372 RepID=A0ABW1VLJ6_9MICO